MDPRTVELFVDLGLPREIVGEIDGHLIDIYRKEHHKKFRFYGFNVQNIIFPIRSPIRKWGDIYDRYRELDSYNVDMFGFPKCIKIYCNKKLMRLIMKKIKECAGKISSKCLSAFVKDHKQAVIEAGCGASFYDCKESSGTEHDSDSDDEVMCATLYYDYKEHIINDEDYFAYFNYRNNDLYSSDSQDVE
jgi:hypothetical protein